MNKLSETQKLALRLWKLKREIQQKREMLLHSTKPIRSLGFVGVRRTRALIVAEENSLGGYLAEILEEEGYSCFLLDCYERPNELYDFIAGWHGDLVILTNTSFRPGQIPTVVQEMKTRRQNLRLIVVSGYVDEVFMLALQKGKVDRFFSLPLDRIAFVSQINQILPPSMLSRLTKQLFRFRLVSFWRRIRVVAKAFGFDAHGGYFRDDRDNTVAQKPRGHKAPQGQIGFQGGLLENDPNKEALAIVERNMSTFHKCFSDFYDGLSLKSQVQLCIELMAIQEKTERFPRNVHDSLLWLLSQEFPAWKIRFAESKALDEQKVKAEAEAKKKAEENRRLEEILIPHDEIYRKFLQIAEQKVSQVDEYGDENWETLREHIETFLNKISMREGKNYRYDQKLKEILESKFRSYHESQKARPFEVGELKKLSAMEFEAYVARVIRECGFEDVRGTPPTGDQGADLLASKSGRTLAIQVKRYSSPVGNKAVQEVIAAMKFYGTDEGWVVTNSTFTPAARALAEKGNIKLVEGNSLVSRSFME